MQYKKQISIFKFRRLFKSRAAVLGEASLFSPMMECITVLEAFRYRGCLYVHYRNRKGVGVFVRYKVDNEIHGDMVVFVEDRTKVKF